MPKEAFGGDGDEEPGEEVKKLGLDKFGLSPDVNIRDLFWKIIGSYAATKKPGIELKELEHDRFALMRVAVSVLSNPDSEYFGLSPKFVTTYSVMMMLDGGWEDALAEFLELSLQKRLQIRGHVTGTIKKMAALDKYRDIILNLLTAMLRNTDLAPIALEYIAEISDPEISITLKKELVIFARGDIGKNQHNAIKAVEIIRDEPEVKKSFIILLSHWDREARLAAAKVLEGMDDEEVMAAVAKKAESEQDAEIAKIFKRMLNG
jgi:DNA-binding FrmR family transcriptional regulator